MNPPTKTKNIPVLKYKIKKSLFWISYQVSDCSKLTFCELSKLLLSVRDRDCIGEDAVLSFCWYFPNLNLQHITSDINPLQLCIIPENIKKTK